MKFQEEDPEENLFFQEETSEDLEKAIEEYFNPPKKRRDLYAISWLAREIKVDYEELLETMDKIRDRLPVYEIRIKLKRDGGQRKIYAPNMALKKSSVK